MIFPLLILFLLLVPGWAAYVIGNAVHRSLVKSKIRHATIIHILTTIGSWIVIMVTILALFYFNVKIER